MPVILKTFERRVLETIKNEGKLKIYSVMGKINIRNEIIV